MRDPLERYELDVLQYNDAVLARLGVADAAILRPPQRTDVIRAWDAALKTSFPDFGIAHALAICSYWSALYVVDGGSLPGFDASTLWRLTAMCWAMVSEPVMTNRIRDDLRRVAHKDAKYLDIDAFFESELMGAGLAHAVVIRNQNYMGRAGPGMLEYVGYLDNARRQLDDALKERPRHSVFEFAREMLEPPLRRIEWLIEHGYMDQAITAIRGLLTVEERATPKIAQLEARAAIDVGKDHATKGDFAQAWKTFENALTKLRLVDGNAPQSSERENTIRLLEYELQSTLAELLTKEAAEICTAARKEMANGKLSASTISEVNRALELLQRAEKPGLNRAAKQAEAARKLLAAQRPQRWWQR